MEGMLFMLHIMGLFAVMISLLILALRNNAKAAFFKFTNNSGWAIKGVSFMVSLNLIVVTLNGFDSTVHIVRIHAHMIHICYISAR